MTTKQRSEHFGISPKFAKYDEFTAAKGLHDIQILQVYPAGHKKAEPDQNFYLIYSSDEGEKIVSENELLTLINE